MCTYNRERFRVIFDTFVYTLHQTNDRPCIRAQFHLDFFLFFFFGILSYRWLRLLLAAISHLPQWTRRHSPRMFVFFIFRDETKVREKYFNMRKEEFQSNKNTYSGMALGHTTPDTTTWFPKKAQHCPACRRTFSLIAFRWLGGHYTNKKGWEKEWKKRIYKE